MPEFKQTITSLEVLQQALGGTPSPLVQKKKIFQLDEHATRFIQHSPFLVLSTSGLDGSCDASPKGDAPGFVQVLDPQTLLIPERPGNKLADSLKNILANPHVGLIFFIPGKAETFRVNGTAQLVLDPEVLETMQVQGKQPKLAVAVTVQEAYLHCGKAILRSKLWGDTLDAAPDLDVTVMLAAHVNDQQNTPESIRNALDESYRERMY